MRIHPEGKPFIIYSFLTLVLINIVFSLGIPFFLFFPFVIISLVLFVFIIQFFRNPERLVNTDHNAIICPADGKVVVIEEVEETEYFKDRRIQVSIFMSPLNVHINRVPVTGKTRYVKYHPGKYLVAWHPKASTENEMATTVIEDETGRPVLIRQIAGAMARRIITYLQEGNPVQKGQELGFIRFGSRVDVLLPLDAKIAVKLNQKVKGNKDIIAHW
ncbi:MAG: phosphatidylserine decarboxylase family protein [Saprospiraceae bacterium]|nr:phosphatidylserine decarboxylase family protein [Saprospiraceae bacterium]